MKVKEIITAHNAPFYPTQINRIGEKQLTSIDRYMMYKNNQDGMIVYYLIDKNDTVPIAAVVVKDIGEYLQIKIVFVKEEYRGKNLAFKMYHLILYTAYKNLMSDTEQTSSGKKVWDDLARIVPIKSLNLTNGEFGDISDAYQETPDIVLVTDAPKLFESLLIPYLKIQGL